MCLTPSYNSLFPHCQFRVRVDRVRAVAVRDVGEDFAGVLIGFSRMFLGYTTGNIYG